MRSGPLQATDRRRRQSAAPSCRRDALAGRRLGSRDNARAARTAGAWHDGPATRGRSREMRAWMDGERMTVNGIELEVLRRGPARAAGRAGAAVARHGHGRIRNARFLDLLGAHAEIIAPSSPGFGNTQAAGRFRHDLRPRASVPRAASTSCPTTRWRCSGCRSAAGWRPNRGRAAAQARPADPGRSGRDQARRPRDPRHRSICSTSTRPKSAPRLARSGEARPTYDAMSDEELVIHARNREALCLYAWHPCLYNPQLKQLARPHPRRRRWSCGATATASSPPITAAPMPG